MKIIFWLKQQVIKIYRKKYKKRNYIGSGGIRVFDIEFWCKIVTLVSNLAAELS
jgi:hypothetical protein